MAMALIDDLVGGRWTDPATGRPAALPFRAVAIAPSLDGREAELVGALGLGRRLAVVSDPATRAALGARVERALGSVAEVDAIVLPDRPHADEATVGRIRAAAGRADALVAVGSGTINDLCKYAAHLDGKPYAVFATAPSMNGYTSLSAAITAHGHKKSLPARGAAGVFIDLEVFAAAPRHLIHGGLGDSLCRATAQVDWLLSHRLRGTAYSETPFLLLAGDEPELFARAGELVRGDIGAMASLAHVLVLSGFGMCLAGSSAPASQAEHLISHYMDMLHEGAARCTLGRDALHGEQVGVATLTVARLQDRLLRQDRPPRLKPTRVDEAGIRAHFGESAGDCLREFRAKARDAAETERVNALLERNWAAWRVELVSKLAAPERLEAALAASGAPRSAGDLGWADGTYRTAVTWARHIRNRYTCLDLIDDSVGLAGWLN
ncbi:MAG: iron-containing alcohol dehydrogenase [Rhodospirillales bacterium]